MGRKKAHTPEEIVAKLRQAEGLVGQGKTVADALRAIGVTERTCYRWRAGSGGLNLHQVKRRAPAPRRSTPERPPSVAHCAGGSTIWASVAREVSMH
jgi:hypothetical protein